MITNNAMQLKTIVKNKANVLASPQMQNFWKKYQKDFDYAKEMSFEAACNTITSIMGKAHLLCACHKAF